LQPYLRSACWPHQRRRNWRTYVSAASGNDANDCNRLMPCRTFQVAHNATLANGEITVLDPGGYGAATITKSISIVNDGVGRSRAAGVRPSLSIPAVLPAPACRKFQQFFRAPASRLHDTPQELRSNPRA
jgi:hypothetical protein